MSKILCLFILVCVLAYPGTVMAADFKFNINIIRQDGATLGELWYNDHMVWRLTLLADGAKPVSGSKSVNTTIITPDVDNGMFLLKVYNQ